MKEIKVKSKVTIKQYGRNKIQQMRLKDDFIEWFDVEDGDFIEFTINPKTGKKSFEIIKEEK